MPAQRVMMENLLHLQGQRRKALPHVGVAGRKPHPYAGRQRDHCCRPSASAVTAAVSVALSTAPVIAPVIRIRVPFANSISMVPPLGNAVGEAIAASGSETTTAGTKPICWSTAPFCSTRNNRRHCNSNDREIPYRRAVAEIWRGACKLSSTILSFSSSDQRRRHPSPPLQAPRSEHCSYDCP